MNNERYKCEKTSKIFLCVIVLVLLSFLSFSIERNFPIVSEECLLDNPGTYVSEDGRYYLSLPPESSDYEFSLTYSSDIGPIVNSGKYEKISDTLAMMKTEQTTMYVYETIKHSKKGVVLVDDLKKEIFLVKESNSYTLIERNKNVIE